MLDLADDLPDDEDVPGCFPPVVWQDAEKLFSAFFSRKMPHLFEDLYSR